MSTGVEKARRGGREIIQPAPFNRPDSLFDTVSFRGSLLCRIATRGIVQQLRDGVYVNPIAANIVLHAI